MTLALSPRRQRFKPSGYEIQSSHIWANGGCHHIPALAKSGGEGCISRPEQRLPVSASMREAMAGANRSNTLWGKMIFEHELSAVDFDGR